MPWLRSLRVIVRASGLRPGRVRLTQVNRLVLEGFPDA